MARGCARGDGSATALGALRSIFVAIGLVSLFGVATSARADWFSENVELHGKASSQVYFNAPSMNNAFQMSQWWNQIELDTDMKLYADENNSLTLHTILMPTYDAAYDVYPKMYGDRRENATEVTLADFGAGNFPITQEAPFARPAMNGHCGDVPGHGARIKGGFCDVNQDTAWLFTGKNNPQMVLDNTIFFGILGSPTRSRAASKQGKLGGQSQFYTWKAAQRIYEALGATPGTNAFLGSLALASKHFGFIHSRGNDYVIGDRYSIEQQAPFGENLTDGQIKTRCFDGAHAWCWAREAYFEAKMGDTQLRIGKQQVVWGKTDAFRLQDLVNPIDFGQHNVYPSLEDRRIPTLSADLVHSFGNVGPLEDVSLELVWVFDKFTPVQVGQCGDFWAFTAACEGRIDASSHGLLNVSLAKVEERKWTFRNTEPGFRFEFRTPEPSIAFSLSGFWGIQDAPVAKFQNLYSTTNPNPAMMLFLQSLGVPGTIIPAFDPYDIAPGGTVDVSSATALATWGALFGPAGVLCPDTANANIGKAKCIANSGLQALGWIWSSSEAVLEYPRTFTLGGSMDYQIPNIDTVLRLEAAYDFNRAINNTNKSDGIDHSDVLLAAIGLDRSFFIPFLNKDRTAFVSFQTFMEHVMNFDGNLNTGMTTYEWSVISTFFIENYWRGDSIVLTNFFAYDWGAKAWITGPKLKWVYNESLFFEVGVNLLQGQGRDHNIRDICKDGGLGCLGDPTTWQKGNWQLINQDFKRTAESPFWNMESFADHQMKHRDEVWMGVTYQF